MKETPVVTSLKFEETFKREAVQNWLQRGKSVAIIAGEFGLEASQLYAWKNIFAPGAAGGKRH